jgi:hypothetical protein
MKFRERYLNDIETGTGTGAGSGGGGVTQLRGGEVVGEAEGGFNAAKYLFRSWRVASLFPEIPESRLVLQFSTPWPQKKFGKEEGKVAQEYEDDAILTAASRILLYFLTSLLHYSSLVQDIFIQTVCNGGLGSLCVLLLRLWNVYPWLAVVAVVVLLLCVYGLGKFSLSSLVKKLEDEQDAAASRLEDEGDEHEAETPAAVLSAGDGAVAGEGASVSQKEEEVSAPPPAGETSEEESRSEDEDDDEEGHGDGDDVSCGGVCIWESDSSSSDDGPIIVPFFDTLWGPDSEVEGRGSDDSEAGSESGEGASVCQEEEEVSAPPPAGETSEEESRSEDEDDDEEGHGDGDDVSCGGVCIWESESSSSDDGPIIVPFFDTLWGPDSDDSEAGSESGEESSGSSS